MTSGLAGRTASRPTPTGDPWLWELRPARTPHTTTLLFLPHAGGNAASYACWAEHFPDAVRLLAAQYPGRGPRYNEPFATHMREWVGPLARAAGQLDGPLALFGHSLGALVGFELAWRLQQRGRGADVLFASAAQPPHLPSPVPRHDRLSDADLAELLRTHGGLSPAILSEPEILELAIEGLRADLTVEQTYSFGSTPRRLRAPIVVLSGAQDQIVRPTLTRAWADRSHLPTDSHVFAGGHFYLLEQKEAVATIVCDRIRMRRTERGRH